MSAACRVVEAWFYCCIAVAVIWVLSNHHNIELDIATLNETLHKNVVGQRFAVNFMVTTLDNYLRSNKSTFPLALVLVGCCGCGKTYAMSLISSVYPLTTELVVSHHMTPAQLSERDFGKEIVNKLASSGTNVITIDDVDLDNDPLCYQLSNMFDKWEQIVPVDTAPTIFILSLSVASAIVEDYALLKLANKEEQNMSELQEEYRQLLPEWMDQFHVVPFLPMRKEHVVQCIRRELASMNKSAPEELVDAILGDIHFYPAENPTFSDSGCKAVRVKLALQGDVQKRVQG